MKQNVKLYIDGKLADVDKSVAIQMNYKHTDSTNPSAVFNSYSQQLTLPRTSANNAIFGHIAMMDRRTAANGFNALKRIPFILYSNTGEIVERGYMKLESITEDGYNITLYGGLGEFLYTLMYDQEGSKKTLAALDFGNGSNEFDFQVGRKVVADAWKHISGTSTNAMYDTINFAPAYEGVPNDFDANKVLCPTTAYGVESQIGVSGSQGATMYTQRNGHTLVKLEESVDGFMAGDLRSYLQRPVIRMKSVINAICNPVNNGGYTVHLDDSFFNNSNPHYNKTWLTLKRLDTIKLPVSSGSASGINLGNGTTCTWSNRTRVKTVSLDPDNIGKGIDCKYNFTVTVTPTISSSGAVMGTDYYAQYERNIVPNTQINRIVVLYQLLAYNSDNEIIGGSKIYGITTKIVGANRFGMLSPYEFVRLYNLDSTNTNKFIPYWKPNASADDYEPSFVTGEHLKAVSSGSLTFRDNQDVSMNMTLNMTSNGVHHIALAESILSGYQDTTTAMTHLSSGTIRSSATSNDVVVQGSLFRNGTMGYTFESIGSSARTGVKVTKALLLSGTQSPADYLISFIKQYNLRIVCHKSSKEISILSPNTFYDGQMIDITDRIDANSISITPYSVASRWYDFKSSIKGAWASEYESKYGKTYGEQTVNTGYEFDANHTDAISGLAFKGTAEVLEESKYFIRVMEDGKQCPSVFVGGAKQTLWSDTNEAKDFDVTLPDDNASITYMNNQFKGYDSIHMSKIQLHDSNNKNTDGSDVLVFYDYSTATSDYDRFSITDDNSMMMQFNDGKPCWLVLQQNISPNYAIDINLKMPVFRRSLEGYTLDFGTPLEMDNPSVEIQSSWSIYSRYWANMFADRYSVDSKVITANVGLHALGGVGVDLMRHFFYYKNSIWIMNAIKNYQVTDDGMTECEFIKVENKTNYTNGQNI